MWNKSERKSPSPPLPPSPPTMSRVVLTAPKVSNIVAIDNYHYIIYFIISILLRLFLITISWNFFTFFTFRSFFHIKVKILLQQLFKKIMNIQKWICMISRSLILQILQAAKSCVFYGAPAEIMQIYTSYIIETFFNNSRLLIYTLQAANHWKPLNFAWSTISRSARTWPRSLAPTNISRCLLHMTINPKSKAIL